LPYRVTGASGDGSWAILSYRAPQAARHSDVALQCNLEIRNLDGLVQFAPEHRFKSVLSGAQTVAFGNFGDRFTYDNAASPLQRHYQKTMRPPRP